MQVLRANSIWFIRLLAILLFATGSLIASQGTWVLILSGILILALGIPHGATDHAIYNQREGKSLSATPDLLFLAFYLGTMGLYGILWWIIPSLALLLFVTYSAYHFGETQFCRENLKTSIGNHLMNYSWGMLVLLLILYPHEMLVTEILSPFIVPSYSLGVIYDAIPLFLGIHLMIFLVSARDKGWKLLLRSIAELIIIGVLSTIMPLLLSFALFFVFWHSLDAIKLQIEGIQKKKKDFKLKDWIVLAMPMTVISILGLAFLIFGLEFFEISIPVTKTTLFFIFISLITIPHGVIISDFYRRIQA